MANTLFLRRISNALFLLMTWVFTITSAQGQPFSIGEASLILNDADRQNREVGFEVFYPADQAGVDVPVSTASSGKFPVVVFGHGFLMEYGAYENIWRALVPEGFVVMLPTTEGGFSPSHAVFGEDLAFLSRSVSILDVDSTSLFYGHLAHRTAVMGHSMGGGAAHLAAASEPAINAIATLAAAETTPSAITAASNIQQPALVIAGSNDCVTPPATHQIPIYNAIPGNNKVYISIEGGSHCLMAESNVFCNIGEMSCSPAPTITREQQHIIINRYLIPWLKHHLMDDTTAGNQFFDLLPADTSVTYQIGGTVPAGKHHSPTLSVIRVYPNPARDHIVVKEDSHDPVLFQLYDGSMRKVVKQQFITKTRISVSHLPPGLYHYTTTSSNGGTESGRLVLLRP